VQVTLLYFDDCPNWRVAAEHLRPLAWENPEIEVSHRLVETIEKAEETTFRGSPSFIVGGVDVFAERIVAAIMQCSIGAEVAHQRRVSGRVTECALCAAWPEPSVRAFAG
jgi:hypothetical protein